MPPAPSSKLGWLLDAGIGLWLLAMGLLLDGLLVG